MVKSIITTLKNKIATLEFWWATKIIKEGVHYTHQIDIDYLKNNDHFAITLLKKPYKGIVVEFSQFQVSEENDLGRVDFITNVVYNPDDIDVLNKAFNKFITNIVRIILYKSIEMVQNEDRDADIVELDEERPVSTEVAAVPEKRVSKRKPRKKTVSRDSEILPEVQQPTKSKRTKPAAGRQKRPDRTRK